jgi:hypothetical protein
VDDLLPCGAIMPLAYGSFDTVASRANSFRQLLSGAVRQLWFLGLTVFEEAEE